MKARAVVSGLRSPSAAPRTGSGGVPLPAPVKSVRKASAPQLPAGFATRKAGVELPWRIHSFGYASAIAPVGRLYFSTPSGGKACSGTLVSANVVMTAAHCIRDGISGTWYSRWIFIPSVDGSRVPYGAFAGRAAAVSGAWSQPPFNTAPGTAGGYSPRDYGFVTLTPNASGHNAGDYTGSFPILLNPPKGSIYHLGYPAEGLWSSCTWSFCRPWECYADVQGYDLYLGGGWDEGMSCFTSGGSSGGPWFQFWNGRWYVASVQSHMGVAHRDPSGGRYGLSTFGPHIDANILPVLRYAQAH